MNRIALVARREFLTTVSRKAFLFSIFLMPLLMAVMAVLLPRLLNSRSPEVSGEIVIVDPTQQVREPLAQILRPEALAAQAEETRRMAQEAANAAIANAAAAVLRPPQLRVVEAPPPGDVEAAKRWLSEPAQSARRIAVIAIAPDAVERQSGAAGFGGYELFLRSNLDNGTENALHNSTRQALLRTRLAVYGIAPQDIAPTLTVVRPDAVLVGRDGEQAGNRVFNTMLPVIMGFLLFMSVMMGGQALMTSTIEEKSSRVVEVLLSAVSPLELMWGKLLGQLGVGLMVLSIYLALGVFWLLQFALFGLLDPTLILWLLVFFIVTYLVYGSLLLSVGAAVSQISDAQALLAPVMVLLVLPMMLLQFIGIAPNSTFSVALSFIPPANTFVMLARMASSTPPPLWQPLLSLGISVLAAAGVVWFAAKVFRIGLLMTGKPPNFATLLRWARMA
ncbi:MAG: ABC transporter permease [Pseudomonadales bacterium]|jgi:ABC-2 type transport system permease protein|nr:ABC transporter permease [Pseudomonadales bacterium]